MSTRSGFLALACMMLLGPAQAPASEDQKLDRVFRDYLQEAFRLEPLMATRMGEHAYDARLDDLSPTARAKRIEHDRAMLDGLRKQVDYSKLTRDGQIDLEIFEKHLIRSIWLAETFHPFEDDPRIYGDYLSESVYLPLTQSSLPMAINVGNVLERMERIPGVVDVARATLKNPSRVRVETAIRQTEGAIAFYSGELQTIAGVGVENRLFAERAAGVKHALGEYLVYLKQDLLPRASGEWRIGRPLFERKLALELDSGIEAGELLGEAEREATRVETEMAVIARQLFAVYFPSEPFPLDDAEGRRRLVTRVLSKIGDDHGEADHLVADIKGTVDEIKEFIRSHGIVTLHEPDQCRILAMPEFMRGNAVAYLNPAPPLDPRGSSEYALSPPPRDWRPDRVQSFLREYNRRMLKILTIHEAYPGHYVQLEHSNRCPSFIRRVLSSGVFAEGWAVYTEQMMLDQGFGAGDPALRLQQLKFYLRAVVNAILDHRMHVGSMTEAEAMELLQQRAFQTEGEAIGKIIRAKQTSCQLSTYFAGRVAFHRLRQEIQGELGARFNLKQFHDAVLAQGTVPVSYLPELVRRALKHAP